jgi:hypothetical protein
VSSIHRMATALTAAVLTLTAAPATAYAANPVSEARPLGLPYFATWGNPNAVNSAGTIVGVSGNSDDCSLRATIWSGEYTVKIFNTPGAWSRAYAINTAGDTVGFVSDRSATGDCHTALPHAVRWDSAGNTTLLGSQSTGYSVATAINDAGDIVGYSFTDPAHAIPVKFVGDQAVPLVTDGTAQVDARRTLGVDDWFRPGLTLTNMATSNIAFSSQMATSGKSLRAFATPVGPGPYIPAGTALRMSGEASAGIVTSANGKVVLGGSTDDAEAVGGTVWEQEVHLKTVTYHRYDFFIGIGVEAIAPAAISPDGTLGVGNGDITRQMGWLFTVAQQQWIYSLPPDSTTTGITNSGLIIGFNGDHQPVTWQYSR